MGGLWWVGVVVCVEGVVAVATAAEAAIAAAVTAAVTATPMVVLVAAMCWWRCVVLAVVNVREAPRDLVHVYRGSVVGHFQRYPQRMQELGLHACQRGGSGVDGQTDMG